MNILDEALIERYVRFRHTLTEQDVEAAERLLQVSAAARDLADFFVDFYGELDAFDEPPDTPDVDAQGGEPPGTE